MKIVTRPRWAWEDVTFQCVECGCRVQFEPGDLGNLRVGLAMPKASTRHGYTARAKCPHCQRATARFVQVEASDERAS